MENEQASQLVYQAPNWAVPPSQKEWALIEVKSGVEIATHSLSSKCTTFGRSDECTIPMLHGSISRLHARIAFDSSGCPWLKDLQSTHGVFVNKKALPKSSISRLESTSVHAGARGVRLPVFPGDVIQFGASTRIYCLQGPSAFERTNLANRDVVSSTLKVPEAKLAIPRPAAGNELQDDLIPSTHIKQWEQLKALRYKIQNLERESSRINAKANVQELTDGQSRQLEANEGKIDQLRGSADSLEDELKKIVFGKSQDKLVKNRQGYLEEEDEVFDRTQNNQNDKMEETKHPQTEQELRSLWLSLCQEQRKVATNVATLTQEASNIQQSLDIASEDDAFFLKNELALNEDNHSKAMEKVVHIDTQITETENLLRVIDSKLSFDREKCLILSGANGKDVVKRLSDERTPQISITSPKPVVPERPRTNYTDFERIVPVEQSTTILPPPKRTKTTAMMATAYPSFDQPTSVLPPAPQRNFNQHDVSKEDQNHDVWVAPKDQDGSGQTKLNKKFAGRY